MSARIAVMKKIPQTIAQIASIPNEGDVIGIVRTVMSS